MPFTIHLFARARCSLLNRILAGAWILATMEHDNIKFISWKPKPLLSLWLIIFRKV